ncbi:MAG: urease accessory protein UreE [Proteobacteria bacterium]|nr:urease accessory protein UreE [Pseudomonadota bacterium]
MDTPSAPLRIEARAEPGATAADWVRLGFAERCRSRLVARLDGGAEVAIALPRGAPLRHGDRLVTTDGRIIEVVAVPEPLLHVESSDPRLLARAAYHLGNRHVAVEVGNHALRVLADAVIERLLRGLGLEPQRLDAPFEPEHGAYGEAHRHDGDTARIAPVIHEFRAR